MKFIKVLFVNIVLSIMMPQITVALDSYTNGVYVENGKTIEIDKRVHEIIPTNSPEILYFSNGLIVRVDTNSDFMINSFYQEVLNTNSTPEKLKSTTHNFAATLTKGSVIVTYNGGEENSSCTISTPYTDHELSRGTFYFQVGDGMVIVFTLDGTMKSTGGRSVVKTDVGYYVIARPNSVGILEAKVFLNTDKTPQDTENKLIVESKSVTSIKDSVMFIKIDGKIIGVVIN